MNEMNDSTCLQGVRVLDLSRILAGPTATQLLGDLGADIVKVEHPVHGDDTRKWGPPFVKDCDGNETDESAYYLSANRNKRSLAIDISRSEGQKLIKKILKKCDVFIENFKVAGLEKYGLDYETLKSEFPNLVYCSITGYGKTGSQAKKPGYDILAQAAGGIMSVTGEPDGMPMKSGVGIADIMCGMYAAVAILAALRYRDKTGVGQHIDVSLLDTQLAWLANIGTFYLTTKQEPPRLGNAHPNIVPYSVYQVADGYVVLGVGNDRQFSDFCKFADKGEFANDPRFKTNDNRTRNRTLLEERMKSIMISKTRTEWIAGLESCNVPCGPVNTVAEALTNEHSVERNAVLEMPHTKSGSGHVSLLSNPLKFSCTPPVYRYSPPVLGEHTTERLLNLTDLNHSDISMLKKQGVIK